ncbi:unnamed protein product, partial [Anisakis simplex]|uniref:MFS domain-containing protein n=1 Tax=Anisakis simplex TaxID=6269 RepID=A0A0M3K3Z7_ANISI
NQNSLFVGFQPIVKSCGDFHANTTGGDICAQYDLWRPQNECVPQLEYQFKSVNVEFDYLCSEGKAVKTSISIQMLGILFGTIFFGQMSDSYGRRTVLLISSTTAIIFGAVSSFAGSLWTMTAWRVLTGFLAGGEVVFSLESPRWLFQKGKADELRKALRRIRGKKRVASEKENKQQHYPYHLFYTWQLLTYSCVIGLGMFITSVINYGLLFNMESLSGSIYINSIFFGAFRWALNIGAGAIDFFVPSVGRKVLHFISVGFIAVCIVINFIVMALGLKQFDFLIRYGALAAAAMCAQLYLTKTLAMVELYPTAIRNIATSTMGILSRIGNSISPQLFFLGEIWLPLPYLTMALMSIWDLINFQVFLPETKGKPLKDHLPGPEECIWRRKKRTPSTAANTRENAV